MILNSITAYRAIHGGNVPALVVVDTQTDNVECIDYQTLVSRSQANDYERRCDEYLVFVVNYGLTDYYANNFPAFIDNYTKTTIKDYLFVLLEEETRP